MKFLTNKKTGKQFPIGTYDQIMVDSAKIRKGHYNKKNQLFFEDTGENKLHCGPTSCVINKKFGKEYGLTKVTGNVKHGEHWREHAWNRNKKGVIIDASRDQFDDSKGIHIIEPNDNRFHKYMETSDTKVYNPQPKEILEQHDKRLKRLQTRNIAKAYGEDPFDNIKNGVQALK